MMTEAAARTDGMEERSMAMTEQQEQEAGDTDTGILLAHAIAIHVLFSEMANMLTNEAREKFETGIRLRAAHLMSGATGKMERPDAVKRAGHAELASILGAPEKKAMN
jgi:hypothetical protein